MIVPSVLRSVCARRLSGTSCAEKTGLTDIAERDAGQSVADDMIDDQEWAPHRAIVFVITDVRSGAALGEGHGALQGGNDVVHGQFLGSSDQRVASLRPALRLQDARSREAFEDFADHRQGQFDPIGEGPSVTTRSAERVGFGDLGLQANQFGQNQNAVIGDFTQSDHAGPSSALGH